MKKYWKHKSNVGILYAVIIFYSALFLYTGISKFSEWEIFKEQLSQVFFGEKFSGFIAYTLPIIEIVGSIGILINKLRLYFLIFFVALLILFTIYVGAILSLTTDAPCSCGGLIGEMSWPTHIVFNIFSIALGVFGIRLERRRINVEIEVSR